MVSNTASNDRCELYEAEGNLVKALVDDFVTSCAEETKLVRLQPTPKSKLLSRQFRQEQLSCQNPSVKSYATSPKDLYSAGSDNSILSLTASSILSNFSQLNHLTLSAPVQA